MSTQVDKSVRTAFQREYGELLLPYGFKYSDKKFVRVIPGVCLFDVSLSLTEFGCYTEFSVMPFCAELNEASLCANSGGQRVDRFLNKQQRDKILLDEQAGNKTKENTLMRQLGLFKQFLLMPFRTVIDFYGLRDLEEKTLSLLSVDRNPYLLYLYLCLNEYDKASIVINIMISSYEKRITKLSNDYDYARTYLNSSLSYSRNMMITYDKAINDYRQKIERYGELRSLIDNNRVSDISVIINGNIELADNICRSHYPKFYKVDP